MRVSNLAVSSLAGGMGSMASAVAEEPFATAAGAGLDVLAAHGGLS